MATTQIDRKRIYGPDTSVVPLPLLEELSNAHHHHEAFYFHQSHEAILTMLSTLKSNQRRLDLNRSMDAIRPIFMQTGVIPQADGSSFIELGKLKLLCAVYGPKPDRKFGTTEKGKVLVHFRFATFANPQRKSFIKDATEKDYSTWLANALVPSIRFSTFPKSLVEIHCTVLENDGINASLAASVTAASLALADAGIEMEGLVTGSSAGTLDSSSLIMDLTLAEEHHQTGSLVIAYMPSQHQITQLIQAGEMHSSLAEEMMNSCVDICTELHTIMAQCLKESIPRKLKQTSLDPTS